MATGTMTEAAFESPTRLTSSMSSLSSSQDQSRYIARTYRQAQQLFITRRLQDALSALEPLIRPARSNPSSEDAEGNQEDQAEEPVLAPIVDASRAARVKVWNLYIAIINQIAELGPDEGKKLFGAEWKTILAKARDGSIWEEVVHDGYKGREGTVDADVVANLATLLLSHASLQKLTQARLETYLSTSASTSLDTSSHSDSANGTSTPKALQSRLKLLEIYTLHVLPRNDEWDYAREFITMSEILDEERKEVFLQELQALRDEKDGDSLREEYLRKEAEKEELAKKAAAEAKQAADAKQAEEDRIRQSQAKGHERSTSEQDYGIDRSRPNGTVRPAVKATAAAASSQPIANGKASASRSSDSSAAAKKTRSPPPGLYKRASTTFAALQQAMLHGAQSLTGNPLVLLRVLFLILTMLAILAQRDIRGRVVRLTQTGWEKVRRTLGMGVKISYI